MTLLSISGLLIILTSSFLFFVTLFYRKNILHDIWALLNLAVVVWGVGCFLLGKANSVNDAMLAWKIGLAGCWFINLFFYHEIYCFVGIHKKTSLVVVYFIALFFITAILTTNFGLTNWHVVFGNIYYNQASIWYCVAVFSWIALAFFSFFTLFKFFQRTSGPKHVQAMYLFFGSLPGFGGGIFTLLPAFGVYVYPITNFAIPLYVVVITYAIFRHQLFDIEVIIKKTLIFTGIFVSVYAVFAFFALLGQIFFEKFITANRWLSMIPSVIIVTLTLRPLERFLINITDKYLFQKKYDYKELLKTFASEVLSVLELGKLISMTEEKLAQIMKLEYCKVVISGDKKVKTEAVLEVPIFINRKEIGVLLLGKKKSDEAYSHDDINMLQSLSNALAIAISNASLIDELTKTQIKLIEKDKMATIGTLAAGMAHEIRNPTTTIRIFSEYVPDRFKDAEFTDRYRNTVKKEVDKIDHIIQTLIDFSGEEGAQEVSDVSAYEAVQELISIISSDKDVLESAAY